MRRLYISLFLLTTIGNLDAQERFLSTDVKSIETSDYYTLPKLDNQKLKTFYSNSLSPDFFSEKITINAQKQINKTL